MRVSVKLGNLWHFCEVWKIVSTVNGTKYNLKSTGKYIKADETLPEGFAKTPIKILDVDYARGYKALEVVNGSYFKSQ